MPAEGACATPCSSPVAQPRTSGATQRGCVMRLTLRVAVLQARRLVKPKSPIFTCEAHMCTGQPRL